MKTYIFLDTNVFLHYRPVTELGLDLVGKDCVLVVPRVILAELNEHKDSHKSDSIRRRARKVCTNIAQWDKKEKVSDELGFEFCILTPSPETHSLSPTSEDDKFLSVILDHPGKKKILFSNDANMNLTAKHLGIEVVALDESFCLPTSLDPQEQELKNARREIEKLKNALPRLEIGLADDEDTHSVNSNPEFFIRPPSPSTVTDEFIEKEVSRVRSEISDSYFTQGPLPYPVSAILGGQISSSDINTYNRKLDNYPEQYRQYLLRLRAYEDLMQFRFRIGIANLGTAPAKNTDIYLHFPDGFELCEKDGLPRRPGEPSLPQKPMTQLQKSMQVLQQTQMPFIPRNTFSKTFSLERTNSYEVQDSFPVIKHNEVVFLPELFLSFPNHEAVKSFACEYRITVANLPDQVTGKINFRFTEESDQAETD